MYIYCVYIFREYDFRNSKGHYLGIPVCASNMDSVGTFSMALALAEHKLFTCAHKFYSVQQWKQFAENAPENVRPSAFLRDLDRNLSK